jgi:DNA-directed RNA polymerase specialized sigma24 family protein
MPRGTTTPWRLSPAAFERLLAALDSDRDRAAASYATLRRRVAGLLEWWGAADPDTLADVTLDRVARKLEEGTTINDDSFGAYVRGVARMVFYESARERRAQRDVLPRPAGDDEEIERRHACLDRCLTALSEVERSLVLRYYEGGRKVDVRRALAHEHGLSMTALRIRLHRLRQRLEQCVSECMARR